MAGPWEKYQSQGAPQAKPWEKYAAPPGADSGTGLPALQQAVQSGDVDRARQINAQNLDQAEAERVANVEQPDWMQSNVVTPLRQGLATTLNGLSFGLADEAYGALGMTETRDQYRADLKQARQDRPVSSFVTEMGGGVATGGTAAGLAKQAGLRFGAMSGGAAAGGVYSASDANDGNRLQAGATGAATGAVLGPVLERTLGPAAGFIARRLEKAKQAASEPVQAAMRRMKPDRAALEALPENPDGVNFLAEAMGSQGRKVAAGLAGSGGPAEDIAMQAISSRQAGRAGRLEDATRRAAGQRDGVAQLRSMEEVRKLAKPMFDAADDVMVPTTGETLESIRQLARANVSFREADSLAGISGDLRQRLSVLTEDYANFPNKVRLGDLRALVTAAEDEASALFRAGRGARAKAISREARMLRARMKTESPQFQQASRMWAGEARNEQAFDLGRDAFKQGAETQKALEDFVAGDIAQSEQAAYLAGVTEAIERKLGMAAEGTGNGAARLSSEFVRDRLRTVLGDDAAKEFIGALDLERTLASFENSAARNIGSQTAFRQESQNALADVVSGQGRAFAADAVRDMRGTFLNRPRNALANIIAKADDATLEELARGLYGPASKSNPLVAGLLQTAKGRELRNALATAMGVGSSAPISSQIAN